MNDQPATPETNTAIGPTQAAQGPVSAIEEAAAQNLPPQAAINPISNKPVEADQPTVISSDLAAEKTQANQDNLAQRVQQIESPVTLKSEPVQTKQPEQPQEENEYDYGQQYDGFSAREQDISNQIDSQKAEISSFYESYSRKVDSSTRATINEITQTYERRAEAQKEINKRTSKLLNVIGYTSGRSRYIPNLQANILAEEERAGQDRLKQIDREKLSLIAQARAAGDEKKFAIMERSMQQLQAKDQEEQALLTELNKIAVEQEKLQQEQLKQMREAEKDMLDYSIKISDAVSGAVAGQLSSLSPEDQQTFILQQAKNLGVDSMILAGAVVDAQRAMQVEDFNLLNTQSLIQSREFGDQLASERFNLDVSKAQNDLSSGGFKAATDLRKEFSSFEPVANYLQVSPAYDRIKTAFEEVLQAGKDKKSKIAGDQALIISYNKLLDPGSVVREGEYDRAVKGQMFSNTIRGLVAKAVTGGSGLTDDERAQIVKASQELYKNYLNDYNKTTTRYRELAAQAGANPDQVAQYKGLFVESEDDIPEKRMRGDMIQYPNGEVFQWSGTGWLNQEQFDPLFGFNPGSGTQANGNLPQKNNNPGNVKIGGIADKFAKKGPDGKPLTDEQGHLIFASREDGLKGVSADIDAKVEGRSRAAESILGRQIASIADMNRVYAEDPNWKNNVVSILNSMGYNVDANTDPKKIKREDLYQAIFRAEGYFA